MVHRDIKPENLLLDEQRNIRIADFGLSTRCAPSQVLRHSCGSPCYAAPEMLTTWGQQHGYVGHPVDVWSCGVTLFAMVCGFLPFEHTSTNVLYKKIIASHHVDSGVCVALQPASLASLGGGCRRRLALHIRQEPPSCSARPQRLLCRRRATPKSLTLPM